MSEKGRIQFVLMTKPYRRIGVQAIGWSLKCQKT